MKKIYILFVFSILSFSVTAQVEQSLNQVIARTCRDANVPPPVPAKTKLQQSKMMAVAATGVVGTVESIHSAFVNWQTGGFTSFSIGTGSVPNGTNTQNIRWGQGLNTTDRTTYGYSYEELRLAALANPGGSSVFSQGQDFYFHLYNGGVDTVIGPLNFSWQNLGAIGSSVGVNIETQFGVNGLGGFANWQATNMMDFYDKVIPIIAQVYGPSSHSYTVNVVNDGNATGTNTFYNGPNWISSQYIADASGKMTQPRLMVHELIHAWRDNVCLSSNDKWHYDTTLSGFEEGMAECVAQIVMDKFAAAYPNYFSAGSSYLNKHWGHEDGMAFDWDYDFQNHDQLTTTSFFSSDIGTGVHWERYGTAAAVFYKMYVEDSNVFKNFNTEYYRRMNASHVLITSRTLMVDILKTVLPKVEEKPTDTWVAKQRILDCKVVPGKKVHMLSYQGANGARDMGNDNRIHCIETQNLHDGNEWSWDVYASGSISERWFHQLNNLQGRLDINNYTTGAITNSLNFRNNDSGYSGPHQGPCLPPTLTGTPCFPIGIDGHSLYTTSADPAITNGGINDGTWYSNLGLAADRYIYKIQTTGLYVYNITFQDGGTITGKYYRLHGNGFIGKDGMYAGVRNNTDTPVTGKMYVEQKNDLVLPTADEELPITINNGTLIAPRIWTSIPETQSQFQGGRTDTRYSKPGKVHIIYVPDTGSEAQKIDFRNITYGSTTSGVQMFLFNVDDFEDIVYTETMPSTLCQGNAANFSVVNNFPDYLDTDTRVTYKWKKDGVDIHGATAKTFTITSVLPSDTGIYTLEITSFGYVIPRDQKLTVTPSVVLDPTVVTPQDVCENSVTSLDVNGTLPIGTTYAWTGPNSFTSTIKNPTITNAQINNQGQYEVTCTVKDCDGVTNIVSKRQIQVNVNPIVTPVIFCGVSTENTVTFNWPAVTGATDYKVSYRVNADPVRDIGNIGNVLAYSVPALSALDNVILYLAPIGAVGTCFGVGTLTCKASAITVCTVPTARAVNAATLSCANSTTTLDGTGSSTGVGINYKWTTSGTGVIVSGDDTLNPIVSAAGTYTLKVTNTTNGGCDASTIVTVTGAYSSPMVPTLSGASSICSGSNAVFTITGTAGNVVTYTGTASGTVTIGSGGTVDVMIPTVTSNTNLSLTNINDGICNLVLNGINETVTVQSVPNAGTNGVMTICSGVIPTNAQLFSQLGGNPDGGGTWSNVGDVYTYTVTATSPCTANKTAIVTITTPSKPNAGISGRLTVCSGITPTDTQLFAQLRGNPDTGGTWSNVGNIYTYAVTAKGQCAGGVAATASVVVTIQALPNAGTSGALTVCSGTTATNAQLFAQLGGNPDSGGTWSNIGNEYTYTVSANSPCVSISSAKVIVTIQALPNAGISGKLTVCPGITPTKAQLFAQLGGTPDTGGTWGRDGNDYIYTVSATSPCVLTSTSRVTVIIQSSPSAGTDGTLTICPGITPTNDQLFAHLGGTPTTGGTWSNVGGNVYTYSIAAASPCAIATMAKVTVTIAALPIAEAGDTKVITCDPSTVKLNGIGSSAGTDITYLWTGGEILTGANTLTPIVSTTGIYTLIVTNKLTGCSTYDTVLVTQNTDSPTLSFSETDTNQYTIVASGGVGPYEYRINSSNNYTVNPIFKIDSSGDYTIYVKDSKGCYVTENRYLVYFGIAFPVFFSPEGNGTNDHWYPTRAEDYPNLEVSIFDRYQRLIAKFKGNNELGWDGTYQGKPLPSGDYWYVVKTNNNKDDREFIGGMTLFR